MVLARSLMAHSLMARCLIALAALILGAAQALAAPHLTASDSQLVLTLDDGRQLRSADLVGATLDVATEDGTLAHVRLERVYPHPTAPGYVLHELTVETTPGLWQPLCDADAYGRRAAVPIAGYWTAKGDFVRDPERFFVSCTAGSQAKCLFFGYDPWKSGPAGQDLLPYYRACQHMVRAAYDGEDSFTTNGTTIDVYDDLGIQTPATLTDPDFAFEAGWTPEGATCVGHTRHPEVITLPALTARFPRLATPCDEARARALGAHLFNRSRPKPTDGF